MDNDKAQKSLYLNTTRFVHLSVPVGVQAETRPGGLFLGDVS
jgi:hypothetical protein